MMVNKLLPLQVAITTLTILLIQIRTATAQSCGANQCYVARYGFCFPLSSDLCMSQATPTTQQQLAPPEESPLSTEDPTTPYAFDWNFTRADDNLPSSSSTTGINIIPWWGWASIVAACLLFCICCNIECGCRSFCPYSKKRRGAAHDSVKTEKETMKNHMVVMKLDRSTKDVDVNDDKSKRPPRKKRESSESKKKPTSRSNNNHRHHNPCPDEWHYRHRYCGLDDLEAQTAQTNETVSSSSDSDGSLSSPDSIFVRMIQDEADRLERKVRDRQSNSLVRSERRMERQQRSRSSRRSKSRNRSTTNNGYDSHHRRSRSSSRRRSKSRSISITNNGYDSSHANSLVKSDVSHEVTDLQRSMERRRSKSRSSRRSKSRNRSTTNNGYDSHHRRRSKSRSKQRDNDKRSSSKSKSQSKGSKAKSSSARSTAPVGKNSKYLQERKQDQLRKSLPPPPRRHEVNRRKSAPPPPPTAVRSSYLRARRSSLEALTAAALPVYKVRPDNSDDPPGLRHRIHLSDTDLNRSYKKERMKDMKSSLTGISLDTKALEVPTKTHDGNAGLFQRSRESLDTTVKYENLSGRPLPVSQHASFRRRSKESLDTQINHIVEDDTSDNGSGQSSSTESHEILEAADFKKLLVAIKSLKSLGDVLLYKTDEGIVEGRIVHVHTDNPLEPYYTIKLPDGTELQTESSRIVTSDTSEDTEDEEDIDVDAAINQMLGFIDEMHEQNSTESQQQPPKASSILDNFNYNPSSNILRSNTFRSILSAEPVESPEDSPEGETSSNSSERGELVDIEAGGNQEAVAERSQDDDIVASMPKAKEPIGRRSIDGYLREWSELLGESSAAIVPQRSNAAASDASSSTTVLSDKLPEEIEFDIEAQQNNNGPHHDSSSTSKRSSVSSLSKNSASTESSRSSTSCTSGCF